ncbi:MAG: Ig-like domain-containing protein [Clostridia bacterium]|nr:Ig-like domain-containing protein [Clostridia bacterium]
MKRLLSFFLIVFIILSTVSCGSTKSPSEETTASSTTKATTAGGTSASADEDRRDFSYVGEISGEGAYTLRGVVEELTSNGFVLRDETGCVYVYQSNPGVTLGKWYSLSGTAKIYGRTYEMTNVSVRSIEPACELSERQPLYLDAELISLLSEMPHIECFYAEIEGELVRSGNYTNVIIDGLDDLQIGLRSNLSLDGFTGQRVTVCGHVAYISSTGTKMYIQMLSDDVSLSNGGSASESLALVGCNDEINLGGVYRLAGEFEEGTAPSQKLLTFSVSDPEIATVDRFGRLKALKEGTLTVTATAVNGVTASRELTVSLLEEIKATDVAFSEDRLILDVGTELAIPLQYVPAIANSGLDVSFELTDGSIAKVENGSILGLAYGQTELRARLGSKSASIAVTVRKELQSGYGVEARADTYSATVTSLEEFYRHWLTASGEKYGCIEITFDLASPISRSELLDDHLIECVGPSIAYSSAGSIGDTLKNQTISFTPEYYPDGTGQSYVRESAANSYTKWINAATVLRSAAIAASSHRRGEDFEDFPLCKDNKGSLPVTTSEQLWAVLEKGYLPKFPLEDSKAEWIFNRAKDVLRDIITEDMNDMQKLRAIYDWLCETVRYDNDVLSEGGIRQFYASNYLEGVFEEGRAVCEGIAKAAVVLSSIEGIPCVMIQGYGSSGGHAWNAVRLDSQWYTFCATFGIMMEKESSDLGRLLGGSVSWTSYQGFLTDLDYFANSFPDRTEPSEIDGIRSAYVAYPLGKADVPGARVDGHIASNAELDALFSAIKGCGLKKDFFVVITTENLRFTADSVAASVGKSFPGVTVVLNTHTDGNGQIQYTVFIK